MLDSYIRSYLEDLKWTVDQLDPSALAAVADVFQRARAEGRQILIVGNGGSAAAASHMACDLGKSAIDDTNPHAARFRTVSLADNSALMTAIANDLSFEDVFAEQLRIVMRDGDVVVFISASGNSPNLLRAHQYARTRGGRTIALLGFGGGRLAALVDHALVVSSRNYGISEDFHLTVMHILTQYLRRAVSGRPRPVAFLDRDGIINTRLGPGEYVERWDQFHFIDGAIPALQHMSRQGFGLIVVTNQQGIGKGHMTAAALEAIHEEMRRVLEAEGVILDGIFHCPHLEEDDCFCRKPMPGLIYRALNETMFLIDLPRSILIGDSESDVLAGRAAGLRTVLVSNAVESTAGPASAATHVVGTLAGAVAVVGALATT